MTFALVPAGGNSRRMGKPKLSLPLGGKTVLEQVIAALQRGGVDRVLVVVNPLLHDLAALASAAGAEAVLLPSETADMRATVEHGLAYAEECSTLRPDDPWLLVPADHPLLNDNVVRVLLEAYRPGSEETIVIPTFQGRRGHPSVIAWSHVAGIRALPAGTGINAYLRGQGAQTRELSVDTADILVDLDTPEDYQELLRRYSMTAREFTSTPALRDVPRP